MPNFLEKSVDGLIRDPLNGALLNIDNQKLLAYKKLKQTHKQIKKIDDLDIELNSFKREFTNIKSEIGEIKLLLQELAKKV